MADQEDVQLLESGSKELQRCDFSDFNGSGKLFEKVDFDGSKFDRANFSNCTFYNCNFLRTNFNRVNFSNSIFSNCNFSEFTLNADFQGATFDGGTITLVISNTNLRNTNFIGIKASRIRFKDGIDLEGAKADSHTDFDQTQMPRAVSKFPIFQGYTFAKGMLNKISTSEFEPDVEQPFDKQNSSEISTTVKSNMVARAESINLISASLLVLIDEFISNHPIPNEPDKLELHNSYMELLQKLREGVSLIASSGSFRDVDSISGPEPVTVQKVITLRDTLDNWWETNKPRVVDYGGHIGLLGMGTGLLILCGAPPVMAASVAALLSGSKTVSDFIKTSKN